MLTFKVSLFCLLLKFGLTEEMFTIYQGKSLKETARAFEIAIKPINSSNHRHCAMQCNFEPQCLAAFFEGEWSLCRLYSNINGATTGGEGDFSMVKREFGVSFGPYGLRNGTESFSDREYFVKHGYITAVRSWTYSPHYLSGIQFRYGSVWGPERGYTGNDLTPNEVLFDPGTFIDRISLWAGSILDVVTFYSETGEDLGTHGSSPEVRRERINSKKLMYLEGRFATHDGRLKLTKVFFHFHGQ